MAIRTVVTRGFGNGTFNGTIPLVVTRGYAIGEAASPSGPACITAVYLATAGVSSAYLANPNVTEINLANPDITAVNLECN